MRTWTTSTPVYVDQWDWEKIITVEDRNEAYLKNVVRSIVSAVCATEMNLHAMFPQLQDLPLHTPNVTFITSQELEDRTRPDPPRSGRTPLSRRTAPLSCMKIGAPCAAASPTMAAPPDYDDWDLNGDLLFWKRPAAVQLRVEQHGHPRQPGEHG